MTATVARLHAGDGYTYLTRQVATGDVTRERGQDLADYYTADGCPPGRWHGRGLAALGVEGRVDEDQMKALFGEGLHPNADTIIRERLHAGDNEQQAIAAAKLGRKFPTYDTDRVATWELTLRSAQQRIRAQAGLSEADDLTPEQRGEARRTAGRVLFVDEHGRPPADAGELESYITKRARPLPQPVSGYDVTFTPPKSVSVLWGIGDDRTRVAVQEAHAAAVDSALAYIEDEVAFTRSGAAGVAQHEAQGLVAARFDHFDSRTGDPNLHTHVAIANRVQGPDGKWRTLDGRLIFAGNVSYSEHYNTVLEDEIRQRLDVEFEDRAMGDGKRPVREIAGVNQDVRSHFSRRREHIERAYKALVKQYRDDHGHEPSRAVQLELAQRANLQTRSAKGPMESLADKRERWRAEAIDVAGVDAVDGVLEHAVARSRQIRRHPLVDGSNTFVGVDHAAAHVVTEVSKSTATWRRWHLYAEAQRAVRGLPDLDAAARQQLAEQITDAAVKQHSILCEVSLDGPAPAELTRANGELMYRVHNNERYTSQRILDAESDLVRAALTPALAPIGRDALTAALEDGGQLDDGQRELVTAFASADRQIVVGIGPAGTGKTRAMKVLVTAAHEQHTRIIGLAPSAAAAQVFAAETGADRADTIDKVLHQLEHQGPEATGIERGDLVVVDEAGMAGTEALARLNQLCEERGAVLRLLGDDQQLGAVAAGGALRTIAHEAGAVRLRDLHRFSDPDEATATLQLRDGDQAAIGFYEDLDRLHHGTKEDLMDQVFAAWAADRDEGRAAVMIAGDNDTVTTLSDRARVEAVEAGDVEPDGVTLSTGSTAGVGDTIVTRRNERRLALGTTDFVKNGDLWTVTDRTSEGALVARHNTHGSKITLPADYVAQHVELGYATTVHRAQGMTVDVAHLIVDPTSTNREQLYVGATRGRHANHLYAVTEQTAPLHVDHRGDEPTTGRDALAQVMSRRDESTRSAHETIRALSERDESLARLVPEYEDARARIHGPAVAAAVDEATVDAPRGIDAAALRSDPAYPALQARLAERAEAGADVAAELREAIERREFESADSPARVLCHRLDANPRSERPELVGQTSTSSAWLRDRRRAIEQRQDELLRRAREDRPVWARAAEAGGRRLDDDTMRRLAAYRDRYEISDSVRPLGYEPESGTARHEEWKRLNRALNTDARPTPPTSPTPADPQANALLDRARRRPEPRPEHDQPNPPQPPQPERGHDVER